MDLGIKISRLEQLEKDLTRYKFIYFGSEFCENKIPTIAFANQVFEFCKLHDKIPVLLTSFLTDKSIKETKILIQELIKRNQPFEVTINDFGLLTFLTNPNPKINCGRLLIKMKKGPEILSNVLNADIKTFKTNSLNNKLYLNFLKDRGIKRFETDLPEQGIELPDNENITLYLGNILLSLTRRCPFIDCDKANFSYSIKDCKKECENYCVVKNTKFHEKLIFMLGNAEFLKTEKKISNDLKGKINRVIVFQGMLSLI